MAIDFDPTEFESLLQQQNRDNISYASEEEEGGWGGEVSATQSTAASQHHSPGSGPRSVVFAVDCVEDLFVSEKRGNRKFKQEEKVQEDQPLERPQQENNTTANTSLWQEVLHTAVCVLKQAVVCSDNWSFALLLLNTGLAHNALDFPGLYTLLELDLPSASRIHQLEEVLGSVQSFADFSVRFGAPGGSSTRLADTIWLVREIFLGGGKKTANAKNNELFIFTTRDDPCLAEDAKNRQISIARIKELQEDLARVHLIPLMWKSSTSAANAAVDSFDLSRFYGALLLEDGQTEEEFMEEAKATVEDLQTKLRKKEFAQRVSSRVDLCLLSGAVVSLSLYPCCLYSPTPAPVFLNAQDYLPLRPTSVWVCEETKTVLSPDQISPFVLHEGRRVQLARSDRETLRFGYSGTAAAVDTVDVVGSMRLLRFVPASTLRREENIAHAWFARPLDARRARSGAAFSALLKVLLARELAAVVRWVADRRGHPILCALIPQSEETTEQREFPAGFVVVRLPFAEDVRRIEPPSLVCPPCTRVQVDAAKGVLKGLMLEGFDPGHVCNPALQRHFAGVEALALGKDAPENPGDDIEPNRRAFVRVEAKIQEWKRTLALPAVHAKAEDPKISLENVKADAQGGRLNRWTVTQLRAVLVLLKLPIDGRKATLVERLEGFFR